MATRADPRALTLSFRAAQARRAAILAALVSAYFRKRVVVDDPDSVNRWLELMLPRVIAEHDKMATQAAAFGNKIRAIEVPEKTPSFTYEPTVGAVREQIERSLRVVGPEAYLRKARDIRDLSDGFAPSPSKQAMLEEAQRVASDRIAGAVARHVQNGGRQTILDGVKADPLVLGYARVTKANPCFFCAALASRKLVSYAEDSFDASDARFTGDGTAKVHDSCGCGLKPVYTTKDPIVDANARFEKMWNEWAGPETGNAMLLFRQNYEGRAPAE